MGPLESYKANLPGAHPSFNIAGGASRVWLHREDGTCKKKKPFPFCLISQYCTPLCTTLGRANFPKQLFFVPLAPWA